MTNNTTERKAPADYVSAAIVIAQRGAVEYLQRHGLTVEPSRLKDCLSRQIKAAIGGALADAKAAFDCNMTQIGVQTFTAAMVLAGIEAAKEAADQKPVVLEVMPL